MVEFAIAEILVAAGIVLANHITKLLWISSVGMNGLGLCSGRIG